MVKYHGINWLIEKAISMELIKILSATGSHIFPKSLIQLNFLAKKPSKKSLKEERQKNIPANNQFNLIVVELPNHEKE